MKRLALTLLAALATTGAAQALDFEVGYELAPSISAPYGIARINLHAGTMFGQDLFILPEVGVFLRDGVAGYARAQVLLDGPTLTIFLDAKADHLTNEWRYALRAGVRFGLTL